MVALSSCHLSRATFDENGERCRRDNSAEKKNW